MTGLSFKLGMFEMDFLCDFTLCYIALLFVITER
jgi:hypothetical protein